MTILEEVREGMRVVDANGAEVGHVKQLRMGDPGAASTEGQTTAGGWGPLDAFLGAEPRVPEEQAERYVRLGYIKVEGKGIVIRDFYAGADQIRDVANRTVQLDFVVEDA